MAPPFHFQKKNLTTSFSSHGPSGKTYGTWTQDHKLGKLTLRHPLPHSHALGNLFSERGLHLVAWF